MTKLEKLRKLLCQKCEWYLVDDEDIYKCAHSGYCDYFISKDNRDRLLVDWKDEKIKDDSIINLSGLNNL